MQAGYILADGHPRFTFSGISVYHPRFFAAQSGGRYSIVPMLKTAMALQQVTGEIYEGIWHDIGTPERLKTLRKNLKGV